MTVFSLYLIESTPLALFDAVEISLVVEHDGECEQLPNMSLEDARAEYPQGAFFWSVYLRYDPAQNNGFGGLECIADLPTRDAAQAYARGVEAALKSVREALEE